MRNFFHALDRRRVRYLLISGQATVLYGASTFSEDVDLWVEPQTQNWRRLLTALADCDARVYKLTPPLTTKLARRGHGFHFTLPDAAQPRLINFVDVMGVVPRVGAFVDCRKRARTFTTPWGRLRVIGARDLARLKMTRRPADYPIISALARRVFESRPTRTNWTWAIGQTFDVEDLERLWTSSPARWRVRLRKSRPAVGLLQ